MRKKRVMVIGPSRCGKTSLVHFLNDYDGPLKRTPDLIYGKHTMDVPSSYLENPWMYKHIIAAAQDASHVLLLVDQSKLVLSYPHGFAKAFRCPVIGIITKADLLPENEEYCIRQLQTAGVDEPYFKISIPCKIGIEELKMYLFEKNEE